MRKNILFISGSFGLGHIFRDIEIANAVRNSLPDTSFTWLSSEPALSVLRAKKEKIHSNIENWSDETGRLEYLYESNAGKKSRINLAEYFLKSRSDWNKNVRIFNEIMNNENFDLAIGDESFDLAIAIRDKKIKIEQPFVIMHDFIGADSMTKSPFEKIITYKINRGWAKGNKHIVPKSMTRIFIGVPEDVPDRNFGFLLPNRRKSANKSYHFTGYILPFNPDNYKNKDIIRKELGYGNESLIVCSVGGTHIGKSILDLSCRSYNLIKRKIPDAKMILVKGPHIKEELENVPAGAETKKYIPELYKLFAASDISIVQGGSTTTLELTALNKPFIYFPVEGHFEQQLHVAPRLERLNAGIKMQYKNTTPESLAETVISNIGKAMHYKEIPLNGARNAADVITDLLNKY